MERSLSDILADLAGVHDQLIALPSDDFGGRADLLVRQDQLRSEIAAARNDLQSAIDADTDIDQLRARVRQLERLVESHVSSRPEPGGGASGDGANSLVHMHEAVNDATGFEAAKGELSRLRARLEEFDTGNP